MRIAFAGTPTAAVPVLDALVASHHDVALVVTQPERPRGRGGRVRPTPVALAAVGHGIPLLEPQSINQPEPLAALDAAHIGAFCVAAFGQILRAHVLDRWPCINVHYSLLPEYRGAAPLERAIMDGKRETGVTIMRMDEGLDTGPMLAETAVPIGADDDQGVLAERLAALGGALIVDVLDALEAGTLVERPQPTDGMSLAPKIGADDRELDARAPAQAIHDRIRALSPQIGLGCRVGGERIKLWRSRVAADGPIMEPGRFVRDGDRLYLGCGDTAIEIIELQPPGRTRMTTDAFLRGWRGPLDRVAPS